MGFVIANVSVSDETGTSLHIPHRHDCAASQATWLVGFQLMLRTGYVLKTYGLVKIGGAPCERR